ncbi:hypothetical protein DTO021D3_2375 [Paecilomyces variotii]|nr:hypothetical protein DTO032I3_8226 [Paecilomyces variotii]KAJ9280905.1 hypothetical protein DTO021D3_2375 [Paecilomyces variotii]KAJ9290935.1 hypothetical protein DTO021C3_1529 [Paecilomyces variotii]KAJ9345301.1 hypothetical protein DTO027B6_2446 [Paecilomyces variotii]KAJ9390445.1 hypothetical protein DTO032I4_1971 [Paecilomyces variotii]
MTSNPRFNKRTTATEVAKAYSEHIKGKTILITGVSPTSIGANTAYALASGEPEQMILASRTKKNIDAVLDNIKSHYPSVKVTPLILDLSSQKSVRDAAAEINNTITKIDLLIANAGIMALPTRTLSPDGIELQFATNHIGHFLFTNLIMDKLRKAATLSRTPGSTRVVMLTSNGHRFSPVRFHDYNFDGKPIPLEEEPGTQAMIDRGIGAPVFDEQGYDPFVAYGQSKTANILFALYLRAKLAREGIQAMSVHPGAIGTNLIRYYTNSPITNSIARCILRTNGLLGIGQFKTTDAGAATTIVAALDPKLSSLKDTEGIYLQDCQFGSPAAHATGFEAAEKLWSLSEELVGEKFVI